MTDLIIFGCGGQGREIASMTSAAGIRILGIVDDSPNDLNLGRLRAQGHAYLGNSDSVSGIHAGASYLVGIANGAVRQRVATVAERQGLRPFTFLHPSATIGPDCEIEPGSVVWPGARLTTNISVGRHVHINQNVTIGHDTKLEDFATVNPAAAISGDCHVGRRALVGAASVVLQGRLVGEDSTVGAGACVIGDVSAATTVVGIPAREVGER